MCSLVLVLAACADQSSDTTTTTTTGPITSTTTSTTSSTTATSNPPVSSSTSTTGQADPCEGEPFTIEDEVGQFTPGCEYRTATFLAPLSVTVSDATWLNLPVLDARITPIGYDEDGDGGSEAKLVFLMFGSGPEPAQTFEEVIARVADTAVTYTVSGEQPTVVGGIEAAFVDFETGEEEGIMPARECTGDGLVETRRLDRWIFQLVEVLPLQRLYGVPACKPSRVWAVPIGEEMVTIVAAVRDDARFDELMPVIEDFLQNSVTFGDGDG